MGRDHPRANNTMGLIIQWTEDDDFDATTFSWKHLLLAGDPDNERPEARGNIQHPGEPLTPREDNLEVPNLHSNPADPRKYSNWPDFRPDGRPRSATVAIRKLDGGPIGT